LNRLLFLRFPKTGLSKLYRQGESKTGGAGEAVAGTSKTKSPQKNSKEAKTTPMEDIKVQ